LSRGQGDSSLGWVVGDAEKNHPSSRRPGGGEGDQEGGHLLNTLHSLRPGNESSSTSPLSPKKKMLGWRWLVGDLTKRWVFLEKENINSGGESEALEHGEG